MTATQVASAPLEATAKIIDMATSRLPGGTVIDPPATDLRMRAKQKERSCHLLGSVAVGGAAFGLAAGKNMIPVRKLNGKTVKLAAWSVAIFALILLAICYRRYKQAEMMQGNVEPM